MAWDDVTIRLHLRQVRVVRVLEETISRLEVEIESEGSVSRCPSCGFECRRVHDTRPKRIRDLEMSGRQTTLIWQRRQFVCDDCRNRHLEEHPEFEGDQTRRLARQIAADAEVMNISRRAARGRDGAR